MIIDLTKTAIEELKNIVETKKSIKPLRIYIAAYGWGGPTFGIALDEHKDGDLEIKVEDFNFIIEEEVSDGYGKFTVDYSDDWLKRGFTVTPDRAGGSC